jgi:hypothetical protein
LAVHEADLGDTVACRCGLAEPQATLGVEGQWLLAQTVLARAERIERDVDVVVVRRADVDDVDIVGSGDLLPTALRTRPAPVGHGAIGEGRVEVR